MADFSALKQSIQNYIKQNGNKEITGAILQNILLSMVTTMGDGAINDNASDISDIKGDIQNINGDITNINSSITDINGDITDINGDITELNGNLSNEVNRAKGAETTTILFSDGKLVFKNAAGTVLYQLSVDSFLSAITTRLNTGALYAGYATPSTTPATLTSQEVFYLATQAGTYTNFHFNGGDDPIVLTKDGIYFIVSGDDDDDWNAEPMLQLDDVPTASSNNAVKSGGVAEELALGAVYDVSAKNPTAGPNNDGKWESLSALFSDANLSTLIPASVRKGGMSIKFVQSSDNKYVQYRLVAQNFTTDTTQWQGVDDEPTAGSDNLVKSGGVEKSILGIYGSYTVIDKSVESGYVGSWSGPISFYPKDKKILIDNDANSYTSIVFYAKDNTEVLRINSLSRGEVSEVILSDDAVKFSGYSGNTEYKLVKLSVIVEDSILNDIFNLQDVSALHTKKIQDLNDNVGSSIDIIKSNTTAINSWSESVNLVKGTYIVSVVGATSLNFYNNQGTRVGYINGIANRSEDIQITDDVVSINGYSTTTSLNIHIVTKNSLRNKFEELVEETNNINDELWNINGAYLHVYKVPESGSSFGSWGYSKTFKAGKYLVKNDKNSYTSFIFYGNNSVELYRANSLSRGETTEVTLLEDAVRVAGYSSTVDSIIDIIIVADNSMEERLEAIEEYTDIFNLNPPSIYDNLIYNVIRSRRISSSTKKLFTLAHFSDIHGKTVNVDRINTFLKRYKEQIDDIICTGDIVSDKYNDVNILNGFPNILALIGNHDAWIRTYDADLAERADGGNLWVVKQSYCYDKFIADNVANWNVVQPGDVATTKKCYYYKDYTSGTSKLRIICLDCMHYNVGADLDGEGHSIQNAWLSDVLTDAKNNSIPVAIAVHYWPSWVSLATEVIKCSYSDTDSIASDYLPDIAIQAVQQFIDNEGEFICWFVGHSHSDIIAVPRDYPKQMFISIDCASGINTVGNSTRFYNTKSQDCFNIITFDTYDKLVKVVRVGSDVTRQLEQKRVLIYRYAPFTDDAGTSHNIGLELSK